MSKGEITVEGTQATLSLASGESFSKSLEELKTFYCLLVGSDVFANDFTCYLLCFDDQAWLIPEMTPGVVTLKNWFSLISESGRSVVAQLDSLPRAWRKKICFIPGIEADLKVLHPVEVNEIQNQLTIILNKSIEELF